MYKLYIIFYNIFQSIGSIELLIQTQHLTQQDQFTRENENTDTQKSTHIKWNT
jgi:hypothetical protein